VGSKGAVVPLAVLGGALARITELVRLGGKQTLELDILRAARDEVKKRPHWYGVSGKRPGDRSR
jgi:hypothetical protein